MQIVIELEDDLYKRILDMKQPLFMNDLDSVYKAIVNGTPLPEHHGRLIDADALESHDEYDGQGFTKSVYKDDIDFAPTIIEGSDSNDK